MKIIKRAGETASEEKEGMLEVRSGLQKRVTKEFEN